MGYNGHSLWKNTPGLEEYAINACKGKHKPDALKDINERFGLDITIGQYRAFLKNRKATSGLGKGHNRGVLYIWTEDEIEYVRSHKDDRIEDVAKALGKTESAVGHMKNKLHVYSSNDGRYKKGFMPKNAAPLGTEIVRMGIIWKKVKEGGEKNNFVQKSHLVYEEHYGKKVPKGYAIAYLDGNTMNLDPENLYLIRNKDLRKAGIRVMIKDCPDIKKAVLQVGQIKGKMEDIYEKYNTRSEQ